MQRTIISHLLEVLDKFHISALIENVSSSLIRINNKFGKISILGDVKKIQVLRL